MKPSFLGHEKPLLTAMIQAATPERAIELMRLSHADGCDAFGVQPCHMAQTDRTPENYRRIYAAAEGKPIYITNYRTGSNAGLSDEELADEMLRMVEAGATLCDVMGDYYCPTPGELTDNPAAIEKQKRLVERIHAAGAEVLMSSHVLKYTPAERVVEIALAQQARGADIAKIVTFANNEAEEMENLRITTLLKQELKIPFLYLSGGECRLHRRMGALLGNCMVLCVQQYDALATPAQPLLTKMQGILDNFD